MRYLVMVQVGKDRRRFAEFEAVDADEAVSKAISRLQPEHQSKKTIAVRPKRRGATEIRTQF